MSARPPRLAVVTIGQAPRPDIVPELIDLLGPLAWPVDVHQYGALDGLSATSIRQQAPRPREARLYTRLVDGSHVVVGAGFVSRRLGEVMRRLDEQRFDLIVLASTGLFGRIHLRTPYIDGQAAVDAWIAALMMGGCELGLIYPLADQNREFAYNTLVQSARRVATARRATRLDAAAEAIGGAAIVLLHSVAYPEAMVQHVAALTGRPVVSARRIIAAAIRLRLEAIPTGTPPRPAPQDGTGAAILTPRECDVLARMLEGAANKEIAAALGISHRTVETHRGRVLAKLEARSVTELMRRMLIGNHG